MWSRTPRRCSWLSTWFLRHRPPPTLIGHLKQAFQTFTFSPVAEIGSQSPHAKIETRDCDAHKAPIRLAGTVFHAEHLSIIVEAVTADNAVVGSQYKAKRYAKIDGAEVCCAPDGAPGAAVTPRGGLPERYSHWNNYGLTTRGHTKQWKLGIDEDRTKDCVVSTSMDLTQLSRQSRDRSSVGSNAIRTKCWLVGQDWYGTVIEQSFGCIRSWTERRTFCGLKNQSRGGRAPGLPWCRASGSVPSQKSWYFICSHRRWSDLLGTRRCFLMITFTQTVKSCNTHSNSSKPLPKTSQMLRGREKVNTLSAARRRCTAKTALNTWWRQRWLQNTRTSWNTDIARNTLEEQIMNRDREKEQLRLRSCIVCSCTSDVHIRTAWLTLGEENELNHLIIAAAKKCKRQACGEL